MKLVIYGRLPDLNEYTRANRANKYVAANLKKKTEAMIGWEIRRQLGGWKTDKPVQLRYLWVEPNRRKDKDNVAFAKKFIQDALVEMGVIPNDGWNNIDCFSDSFDIDKNDPRVEVEIVEVCPGERERAHDA